jgi:NADPH-dependent curcumin reductase CurA
MNATTKNREIRLASRPEGEPTTANFELATVDIREPAEGEALVRNVFMSVEPYMRGRMKDAKSYVPPFKLGEVMSGGAIGRVVRSRSDKLKEGTWVQHELGWRDYATAPVAMFRAIPVELARPTLFLGALGAPGLTAYVGLHDIGHVKAGDVVFVSSAAGAVGSMAGQIAKLAGATVIGSAGGPEKVDYLTETLKFDAAFDYKRGHIVRQLAEAAPNGIDLYFDNVGGEQLEAALFALNDFGRIVACGAIASYSEPVPGPRNLAFVVGKRLTMRGFIILDHLARMHDFVRDIGPLVHAGKIVSPETIVDGLENAPQAFLDLMRGGTHLGKVIVRIGEDG